EKQFSEFAQEGVWYESDIPLLYFVLEGLEESRSVGLDKHLKCKEFFALDNFNWSIECASKDLHLRAHGGSSMEVGAKHDFDGNAMDELSFCMGQVLKVSLECNCMFCHF
ncbi:unnamed protein product, partial [Notodromas monacha]